MSSLQKGYKRTELGVIPVDWEVSTIGKEFEIKLGKMLDAAKNTGIPKLYLNNKAVQWGLIDINDLPTVLMSRADLDRYRLRHGDLLVCEGGEVGRAAIWKAQIPECYYQKALHRLRPLGSYHINFMLALFKYFADHGLFANYITQTSIAHLTREKLADVPIPLPPLAEQKTIARSLSDTDELIAGCDRAFGKKRNIKQGAMQQLLTGKVRLPGFSGEWEVKKLGEIGEFKNGINKGKEDFGFGYPFVNLLDVFGQPKIFQGLSLGLVNSSGEERKIYELRKGDILFIRSSVKPEGVGLTSVVQYDLKDTVYSGFLIRFRDLGKLDFEYKVHCFNEEEFRKTVIDSSTVSANTNINQDALKSLKINLPPLPEQKAIAQILSDMDAEIAALEKKRDKYKAIKQGMMQELLTGKTRLIDRSAN